MAKFMIIGPLSKDRIIKEDKVYEAVGGPVYYQAAVFSQFGHENTVVTTLASVDEVLLDRFPQSTQIIPIYKDKTMEFENIYPDDNPNHRIQKSKISINPISTSNFDNIDLSNFDALLISPLSPYDVPLKTLKFLKKQGKPIYLGAQGYLRHLDGMKITLKPWTGFKAFLKLVNFLFLDELEARVMLADTDRDCGEIARSLTSFGPEEVIVTRGDRGALIYSKIGDQIYDIPAVYPKKIIDPTGLGDTFMAAYALKKLKTSDPAECGKFATQISSLKMEREGAYKT
jgi:sugar/nucleoside kinase (ribokinase family)